MRSLVAPFLLAGGVVGFGSLCKDEQEKEVNEWPAPNEMPRDLRVAMFGDQGLKDRSVRVLNLIKDWNADFTIHLGDFDYSSNAQGWMDQVDSVLGSDYPYFAAIGNHDVWAWNRPAGYEFQLENRVFNMSDYCTGRTAVKQTCYYKGLLFVMSGVGVFELGHPDYIDEAFSHYPGPSHPWKLCGWHKNQRLMQIGGKPNETGWAVYEMCRLHGAIIATGHEHSFCRSHLMSDIENQVVVNENNTLAIEEGESFVFVSGVGGQSIRPTVADRHLNPWWAAWGSSDINLDGGVMLCIFNVGGDLRRADCEFRDINGVVYDTFQIRSSTGLGNTDEEKADRVREELAAHREGKCVSQFVEIPVTSGHDDGVVGLSAKMDVHAHAGVHSFVFRDVPAFMLKERELLHAYLQLYASETGPDYDIPMVLRVHAAGGIESTNTVEWVDEDVDEEPWDGLEVQVSPDLRRLMVPQLLGAVQSGLEVVDVTVTLEVPEHDARPYFTFDASPCFAPTLTLELSASEDC